MSAKVHKGMKIADGESIEFQNQEQKKNDDKSKNDK